MKVEPGSKIGEYRITARIGRGRYGVCFLAEDADGNKVAVKKFKPRIFKRNAEKNKFEAVILSSLSDARVPELLGVINEPGSYCFVLEYKPGITLKDMLFKYGHRFTPAEFYDIGLKLMDIVSYLHSNGVVHRDIRVPNVLLDGDRVYLIDFGLARWADGGKYRFAVDFSYLGDLFLYLLYSSYDKKAAGAGKKNRTWHEELPLSDNQKIFMKKMFAPDSFSGINEVRNAFECFSAQKD